MFRIAIPKETTFVGVPPPQLFLKLHAFQIFRLLDTTWLHVMANILVRVSRVTLNQPPDDPASTLLSLMPIELVLRLKLYYPPWIFSYGMQQMSIFDRIVILPSPLWQPFRW